MRARRALVLALTAVVSAGPASASWRPDLVGELGGTFAVDAEPSAGGVSMALSAMWPVDPPFGLPGGLRFGVMGFADDMGSNETRLTDPNDPSLDLGPAEDVHRMTWGGAWRLDATASTSWWGWSPMGTLTWGAWRVQDDVRGDIQRALTSTGLGVGLGLDRRMSPRHTLGVGVRYQRLFNDAIEGYMTGGVSWRWSLGI